MASNINQRISLLQEAAKITINPGLIKATRTFALHDKVDATEVHNYLKRYGYMPLAATPAKTDVGEVTTTAVKAFQEFFDLKVDGVFGPETRDAMTADRCGFPDLVTAMTVGPWKDRNIRYCFGTMSKQIDVNVCKAAIRRAMTTWTNAGVGLTFTEVQASQGPEVFIEFRPAKDPDLNMVGGILAHADFPPEYSVVVQSLPLPLHYDDEEHKWVDGAVAEGFDIETIGLHEFGHILGLGHTNVQGAVMFPTVSPNFLNRTLSTDDQYGIRNLYPIWRYLGGLFSGK
jgi:hypothetical protein